VILEAPAVKVNAEVLDEAESLKASAGVVPAEHVYCKEPVAVCRPDAPALIVPNPRLPAPLVFVIEQLPCTTRDTLEAAVADPANAADGKAASAASATQESRRVIMLHARIECGVDKHDCRVARIGPRDKSINRR
jgi:hypothetical protein